jgi:hypothetical protein
MHCPPCHRVMRSISNQVVEDEQGVMTITRGCCQPCHKTANEIWLSAGYRGPDPALIRYAIVPQRRRPILTAARAASERGIQPYASVI